MTNSVTFNIGTTCPMKIMNSFLPWLNYNTITIHDKCSLYLSETHVSLRRMIKQKQSLPLWAKAISTELEKFRAHNCLLLAHFTGQHLVPMKWIFSIKTDGTYKARLVGRGDLMIPWIDFNPKEGSLLWQYFCLWHKTRINISCIIQAANTGR